VLLIFNILVIAYFVFHIAHEFILGAMHAIDEQSNGAWRGRAARHAREPEEAGSGTPPRVNLFVT
jgi:hypothetical protein